MAKGTAGQLDVVIGEKLRRLRKRAGLSERQVGVALGVSQQLISGQERGMKQVSLAQLLGLATLYQKTFAQFVEEMDLENRPLTHFAEAQQVGYHAETMDTGKVQNAADLPRIDLSDLIDPADRKAVIDLFERLKRNQGSLRF